MVFKIEKITILLKHGTKNRCIKIQKIINIETRDRKSMYRNSIKMSKKTKFPFLAGRQIYFFTKSVRIDEISVRSARFRYIFCQKNTPN